MFIYIAIYGLMICSFWVDFTKKMNRTIWIYFIGVTLILLAGLRGTSGIDSPGYIKSFHRTDISTDLKYAGVVYKEFGFYYLTSVIKMMSDKINFYFIIISLLSVLPLIKSLNKYCIYPVLGICVYFARFFPARNMNQIRAALAIAIVIYALKYLINHQPWKYVAFVVLSCSIHYSMIIALMFFPFYNLKIRFRTSVLLLVLSVIFSFIFAKILTSIGPKAAGSMYFLWYAFTSEQLGLTNPVLVFQVLLCLLFFYYEKKLSTIQKGYYVIRNAYYFSTVILILTADMGMIGGRLATLFATCEIFVIPALIQVIRPKLAGYFLMAVMITLIFYLNYDKMLINYDAWTYKINF